MSASQSRAADSTSVSSTVCRSKVERLMALSTSAVAVCCSHDSRSSSEQAGVLDRDHGLAGEVLDQLDLLVGERAHLLAVNTDCTDDLAILEHGNGEETARPGGFDEVDHSRIAVDIRLLGREIVERRQPLWSWRPGRAAMR